MSENPEYVIKSLPPEPRPTPPKDEGTSPVGEGETPVQPTAQTVPAIIKKSLDPTSEGESFIRSESGESTD